MCRSIKIICIRDFNWAITKVLSENGFLRSVETEKYQKETPFGLIEISLDWCLQNRNTYDIYIAFDNPAIAKTLFDCDDDGKYDFIYPKNERGDCYKEFCGFLARLNRQPEFS